MIRKALKSYEAKTRDLIAPAFGFFFRVRKINPEQVRGALQEGRVRKILLVRTYQGLGDLLCATPVISNLKSSFPEVSIHFLANTFNQAALKGNPHLERIWAWDEKRRQVRWLGCALRRRCGAKIFP